MLNVEYAYYAVRVSGFCFRLGTNGAWALQGAICHSNHLQHTEDEVINNVTVFFVPKQTNKETITSSTIRTKLLIT